MNKIDEAIRHGAIPARTEGEAELNYGACIYCGQMYQIEMIGHMSAEELNERATSLCNCSLAKKEQKRLEKKLTASEKLEKLTEGMDEEITALLRDCIEPISNEIISGVTVKVNGSTKMSISMNSKGNIEIKKECKTSKKMEV